MNSQRTLFLLALLAVVGIAPAAACPVCVGAKDAPMTAGLSAAILVMIGITGVVLTTISTFFLIIWRRYRAAALSENAGSVTHEQPPHT